MVACEHFGAIELIMAIGAPQSQSRWQSPVSILAPLSSLWQSQSRWQSPASILAPLSLRSGAPHTPSSSTCSSGNQWQSAPIRAHHRPSCAHAELKSINGNGNQWQSSAIVRTRRARAPAAAETQSIAIHRNPSQSVAISGHHLQKLGRVQTSGLCEAEALAVRSHHRAHDL